MSKLTEEEREVIAGLRDQGFAVVVYNPTELQGIDPERIEGDIVNYAEDLIHHIAEEHNE